MPARALGAPHTTCNRSLPVSTSQHLQLVGVRMLLGLHHFGDRERPQARSPGSNDLFDLEPDAGQRVGDLVDGRVRVEMLLQP